MPKVSKCPRITCKNEAIIDSVFGVLPCVSCQKKDEAWSLKKLPEFYSLNRMSRVQRQRDLHEKDMLQPFEKNKANPDYFKAYPNQVDQYGVREELAKV